MSIINGEVKPSFITDSEQIRALFVNGRTGRGMMMKSSREAAIFRPVLYNRLIDRLVKRASRVGYAGLAAPIINFPVFKIRASFVSPGLPICFFHEPRPRMIYEESTAWTGGFNPIRVTDEYRFYKL